MFFVIKYYSACYEQTILNSSTDSFLLDSNSFASVEEAVDDCGHDRIQCQAQCTEIWKKCNNYSKAINHNYLTSSTCLKFFSKWNCYKRMGKKQLILVQFFLIFEHSARHITLNVWMVKLCANVNLISFVWITMEKKMG